LEKSKRSEINEEFEKWNLQNSKIKLNLRKNRGLPNTPAIYALEKTGRQKKKKTSKLRNPCREKPRAKKKTQNREGDILIFPEKKLMKKDHVYLFRPGRQFPRRQQMANNLFRFENRIKFALEKN
jgi:hypothetical protein